MGSFGFKVRFFLTILSIVLMWAKVSYPLEYRSDGRIRDTLFTCLALSK